MIIVWHIVAVMGIFAAGYITCGLLTRNTIHEEYMTMKEYLAKQDKDKEV